jgi:hypothetical protein
MVTPVQPVMTFKVLTICAEVLSFPSCRACFVITLLGFASRSLSRLSLKAEMKNTFATGLSWSPKAHTHIFVRLSFLLSFSAFLFCFPFRRTASLRKCRI